jgi:hypothetical protein
MPCQAALPIPLLQYPLHGIVWRRSGRKPAGSPSPAGEQQRRLLRHWGLHSAKAGRGRPQEARPPRGAIVGEVLVLTARELRLVLTLLLAMFMTSRIDRRAGSHLNLAERRELPSED